jgi:hypothetical protein
MAITIIKNITGNVRGFIPQTIIWNDTALSQDDESIVKVRLLGGDYPEKGYSVFEFGGQRQIDVSSIIKYFFSFVEDKVITDRNKYLSFEVSLNNGTNTHVSFNVYKAGGQIKEIDNSVIGYDGSASILFNGYPPTMPFEDEIYFNDAGDFIFFNDLGEPIIWAGTRIIKDVEGTYVSWLNANGGYSFWVFPCNYTQKRNIKSNRNIVQKVDDYEVSIGAKEFFSGGYAKQDSLILTDQVLEEELPFLKDLAGAHEVYLWLGEKGEADADDKWVSVQCSKGSDTFATGKSAYKVSFVIDKQERSEILFKF